MKKIGLISLALVLALGGLGFAYAHWSDTLYIEGTVKAGSVTLAFIEEYGFEDVEDKDVGYGEIIYSKWVDDPHSGKGGYTKMHITVHDAYPCYEAHFTTVIVHNIGTIPVILEGLYVTPTSPAGLKFDWVPGMEPPWTPATGYFWIDYDDDTVFDPDEEVLNIEIVNFMEVQLEPCEWIKGEIDLHLKQNAKECTTYEFEVEIEGVQWNKSIYWP